MTPDDFDSTERLREEHHLGEPIALLSGWLSLYLDGDVDLDQAIGPLTRAALKLNTEILELGRAARSARRKKARK